MRALVQARLRIRVARADRDARRRRLVHDPHDRAQPQPATAPDRRSITVAGRVAGTSGAGTASATLTFRRGGRWSGLPSGSRAWQVRAAVPRDAAARRGERRLLRPDEPDQRAPARVHAARRRGARRVQSAVFEYRRRCRRRRARGEQHHARRPDRRRRHVQPARALHAALRGRHRALSGQGRRPLHADRRERHAVGGVGGALALGRACSTAADRPPELRGGALRPRARRERSDHRSRARRPARRRGARACARAASARSAARGAAAARCSSRLTVPVAPTLDPSAVGVRLAPRRRAVVLLRAARPRRRGARRARLRPAARGRAAPGRFERPRRRGASWPGRPRPTRRTARRAPGWWPSAASRSPTTAARRRTGPASRPPT